MAATPLNILSKVASAASTASAPSSTDDKSVNKKELDAKTKQESEKDIKTASDKLPAPQLQSSAFSFVFSLLGPDVTKIIGNCQNSAQLAPFSKIMKFTHNACQSDLEKRQVTDKILPHVFNAKPDGIKSLFNKNETAPHPKLLLTKSSYKRGYFSKKLNKVVCVEHLKSVSAWQAAFLCTDGPFLGLDILTYLIADNSLSQEEKRLLVAEARKQLGELINRIPVKAAANNAATTIASVTTANVTVTSPASEPNNRVNCKEKDEQNSTATNTKNEFGDSFEFLGPVKKLIKALETYIEQYNFLAKKGNLTEDDWVVLDPLWEIVGECQKELPHCVLQKYCGPTPFYPLTEKTFTTSPPRADCLDWSNKLLDLDSFGIGTACALYKGAAALFADGCSRGACVGASCRAWAERDLAALNRLCELRETHLRNTFNCLQTLESALTLIGNDKTQRLAL